MQHVYVKLLYLIKAGCIFVGHGLDKDFRIINILPPQEQIVDTVDLFRKPGARYIGLAYLNAYFLNKHIQTTTHDSTEDAIAVAPFLTTGLGPLRSLSQAQSRKQTRRNHRPSLQGESVLTAGWSKYWLASRKCFGSSASSLTFIPLNTYLSADFAL